MDQRREIHLFQRRRQMIGNRECRIEIARHAFGRAQQRGVTRRAIYWTIEYGQPARAVGGAVRRTMTRNSARRMIEFGFPPAEVSKCLGTVIMTKDTDAGETLAITVRPTEKNGRKRGRKHKPRHGKSRQQRIDTTRNCFG